MSLGDVDGDRLGSDRRLSERACLWSASVLRRRRRLLFAPFAIYLYRIVCFYQLLHYRHSHTHARTHRLTLTARTHTHTLADRSGRGKANEFTQKKLHNALRYFYETCSFLFVVSSFLLFLSDAQGTTTTTTNTAFIFVVERYRYF